MMMKKMPLLALGLLVAAPSIVLAHPGHGVANGIGQGLLHPLSGLDHLLALVAIGLLAARTGGRALWAAPLAFIACCMAGGALAASGFVVPMIELTIVASVLVGGVLLARRQSVPVLAMVLMPLFGVAHGYAHIHELSNMAAAGSYSLGIVLASMALIGVTIGAAKAVERARSAQALSGACRLVGTAMAAAGLLMLAL